MARVNVKGDKCHVKFDEDFDYGRNSFEHKSKNITALRPFLSGLASNVLVACTIISMANNVVATESDFDKFLRGVSKLHDGEIDTVENVVEKVLKDIIQTPDTNLLQDVFEDIDDGGSDTSSSLPSWVISQYGQDRSEKWLGTGPEYVLMNTYNDRLAKRQREMDALEEVKRGLCGGFDDQTRSLSSVTSSSSSSWHPVHDMDYSDTPYDYLRDMNEETFMEFMEKSDNYMPWFYLGTDQQKKNFLYCDSNVAYRDKEKSSCQELLPKRHFCRAPHPTRKDFTISIERVGPFVTTGGNSWTSAQFLEGTKNLANLTHYLQENPTVSIIGGMVATVHANGSIIEFPPLHIHHAHVYPYGSRRERHEKILGSDNDEHDLLFQSHGETACSEDQGGNACLLNLLDEGEGYRIINSKTGLSTDWDVNDVRPKGSDPLEWYLEIVIMHKPHKEPKAATFMGVVNPCVGAGPCTYAMPLDPNSNLMFYEYTHKYLRPGTMKNWVFHTHMNFADSIFLFKGHGARAIMEDFFQKLQKNGSRKTGMPIILDCHGHTLESAKKEILDPIMKRDDALLVCEMTKTSMNFKCDPTKTHCQGYDRRAHLNCLKELAMNTGDVLAMIGFNHVRPQNITRTKNKKENDNGYSGNLFAAYQHTVFRADFITEDEYVSGDKDTPPAIWLYGNEEFIDDLVPEYDVSVLEEKTAKCPSSIRYAWDLSG